MLFIRLMMKRMFQLRFKLIVKDSYGDSTFIFIKIVSIEGSIFHFPRNFIRSLIARALLLRLAKVQNWVQFPLKPYLTIRY